jgi:heme-degrading monooxygenase HmoA
MRHQLCGLVDSRLILTAAWPAGSVSAVEDAHAEAHAGRTRLCEGERILTVQELRIIPGREEQFIARFAELDVLGLAADAAGGTLTEASVVQDGSTFAVVTSWQSARGLDGWVASPSREKVREALGEFYVEPPTVVRYSLRAGYSSSTTDTPSTTNRPAES